MPRSVSPRRPRSQAPSSEARGGATAARFAGAPAARASLADLQELGWRILAEEPGREIVFGTVTQPWQANVRFRGIPPEDFAAFAEPGFVKIVWNLAVEPRGATASVFRTETRVATTDADARRRFRRYWAVFSPGIRLIRRVMLRSVRDDAEARHRAGGRSAGSPLA